MPPSEAEAFQLIRAHLRYFNVDRELRTLLVASAAPGDGKTTVARHLASAAASMGSRVLLLEADLRHPTLAQQLDVQSGPGVSDVLIGAVSLSEATQMIDLDSPSVDGSGGQMLDVVVAGAALPPNPGELIESHAMEALLEQAKSTYDLVVIDTPPLAAVSDAFPLLRKVDGVIIVGRMGRNRRDVAERLHETLAGAGAPLLGVVANGFKARRRGSYGYAYEYGYAETQPPAAAEVSVNGASANGASADQASVEEVSANGAYADQASVEEVPADQASPTGLDDQASADEASPTRPPPTGPPRPRSPCPRNPSAGCRLPMAKPSISPVVSVISPIESPTSEDRPSRRDGAEPRGERRPRGARRPLHRAHCQGRRLACAGGRWCRDRAGAHPREAMRPRWAEAPATRAGGLAVTALMLLPGALIVFMGFNAGGYFPATTGRCRARPRPDPAREDHAVAPSVRGAGARHARRDRRARAVHADDAPVGVLVSLDEPGADRV